ncbi:hypothetical protein GWI33_002063 [Rhynchophorus ferrugineus]|uniref:Uncharacterized protein n=1 Tax=Rhynchophorus ferrugineus TaxID=354439 RepID=A0A834IU35_RHYFE|nr:hypothetical protein GWI33_002063 [Rhynchophorus ferrugineus]
MQYPQNFLLHSIALHGSQKTKKKRICKGKTEKLTSYREERNRRRHKRRWCATPVTMPRSQAPPCYRLRYWRPATVTTDQKLFESGGELQWGGDEGGASPPATVSIFLEKIDPDGT